MIDTVAYLIYGYQINEEQFNSKLDKLEWDGKTIDMDKDGNDGVEGFDSFLNKYGDGWSIEPDEVPVYIGDPMMGKRGFFGYILKRQDCDSDQNEDCEIKFNEDELKAKLTAWTHEHTDLATMILRCTNSFVPKFLFVVQKS